MQSVDLEKDVQNLDLHEATRKAMLRQVSDVNVFTQHYYTDGN